MDIQKRQKLCGVKADLGHDFHPISGHMAQLRNFTKGVSILFSINLGSIIKQCNSLSQEFTKTIYKRCTNELACHIGY